MQGHDSPTREDLERSGSADSSEVSNLETASISLLDARSKQLPVCEISLSSDLQTLLHSMRPSLECCTGRRHACMPETVHCLKMFSAPQDKSGSAPPAGGPSGRLGDPHVTDSEGMSHNARPGEFAPNDPKAPAENTPENARKAS